MVDSALPLLRFGEVAQQQASPLCAITVLFERETEREGKKVLTSALLSSSTSVQQLKLSGPHRGWFKSGDRLVSAKIPYRPAFLRKRRMGLNCRRSKHLESHPRLFPLSLSIIRLFSVHGPRVWSYETSEEAVD